MKKMMWAAAAAMVGMCAFAEELPAPVKYVFLFIGDGMSFPQRMMADEFYFRTEGKHLAINSFPYQTPTVTRSADSFITDSAASGTAIACGAKTKNHYVGVDENGERLESTAEVAKKAGRKVGIVTSVTLNHATPASFYGHNTNRGEGYKLGLDFIASGFDYFGGGGFDGHDNKKDRDYKGDIYDLAEQAGYKVSRKQDTFDEIKPGCGKALSMWNKDGALPYAIDRKPGAKKLSDFVAQAIAQLEDSPSGFFLMTEGGKIDWMCHANDAATVIREVIDLDQAVEVALEFQQRHPDDTLIVVTGDHETGGLTLGFANTGYSSFIERLARQKCSRDVFIGRTRELASSRESLAYADLKPIVEECFGLVETEGAEDRDNPMRLHTAEREKLREAFAKDYPDGACKKLNKTKNVMESVGADRLATAAISILDNKCALGWTSGAHTALPVNTTAKGARSELFTGMIDNTDIAKKLKTLVR